MFRRDVGGELDGNLRVNKGADLGQHDLLLIGLFILVVSLFSGYGIMLAVVRRSQKDACLFES
jgi:hypothetical protein